jgi:hypothetical protein
MDSGRIERDVRTMAKSRNRHRVVGLVGLVGLVGVAVMAAALAVGVAPSTATGAPDHGGSLTCWRAVTSAAAVGGEVLPVPVVVRYDDTVRCPGGR